MMTTATVAEPLEALLDVPIRYVERSRAYYMSLGYDNPYRWAQNEDVPFTKLRKPLRESRVAIIGTAALYNPEVGAQGRGRLTTPMRSSRTSIR